MPFQANPCISVTLVVLYWMNSAERGVDSAQCCLTQAGARFCLKRTQLTLASPVPLSPSFSFSLFHANTLYRLYGCFQRRSPWRRCDPLLLSTRSSVAGLIDGRGVAIKTICCCQIRPDKHGPQLLTSQECLFMRENSSIFCPQSYRHECLISAVVVSWDTSLLRTVFEPFLLHETSAELIPQSIYNNVFSPRSCLVFIYSIWD